MLKLTYSSHCVLPDSSTLLAVVETRTEQRWFWSREVSETRSYVLKGGSWASPSSALVAGVASFYLAQGGPRDTFTALDHRDGTTRTVRFAAPTLEVLLGPIFTKRQLTVEFVQDDGGTTPVATTYVAPTVADFCDPVVPTSGVVSPGDAVPRDAWPWTGVASITSANRWVPLNGMGGATPNPYASEAALPSGLSFVTLTLRALDIGSAGSVRLRYCVNGVERTELSVIVSATAATATATGTITTSQRAGTLACLQTSLFTSNAANGASIAWGVGYTVT